MNRGRLGAWLWFAVFLVRSSGAARADSVQEELRQGRALQASELLGQLPVGGARQDGIRAVLEIAPLLHWSPEAARVWSNCMAAIEGGSPENLGDLMGALAAPATPRNAETSGMVDRAVAMAGNAPDSLRPPELLVVGRGLIWLGQFDRAFSLIPSAPLPVPPAGPDGGSVPAHPLAEFALETLADKPGLAAQDGLWKLALGRIGDDPLVNQKAVHALAFCGRMDQAWTVARGQKGPLRRFVLLSEAARYARYGGRTADYVTGMQTVAASLKTLPMTPEVLPALRDFLGEAKQPPMIPLPDGFWSQVESWAKAAGPEISGAALTEVAGVAAWADRPEAADLTNGLSSDWQDAARMRVACGWAWAGQRIEAEACAASIRDLDWRTAAIQEMAYLEGQRDPVANAKKLGGEAP